MTWPLVPPYNRFKKKSYNRCTGNPEKKNHWGTRLAVGLNDRSTEFLKKEHGKQPVPWAAKRLIWQKMWLAGQQLIWLRKVVL